MPPSTEAAAAPDPCTAQGRGEEETEEKEKGAHDVWHSSQRWLTAFNLTGADDIVPQARCATAKPARLRWSTS